MTRNSCSKITLFSRLIAPTAIPACNGNFLDRTLALAIRVPKSHFFRQKRASARQRLHDFKPGEFQEFQDRTLALATRVPKSRCFRPKRTFVSSYF